MSGDVRRALQLCTEGCAARATAGVSSAGRMGTPVSVSRGGGAQGTISGCSYGNTVYEDCFERVVGLRWEEYYECGSSSGLRMDFGIWVVLELEILLRLLMRLN